MSSPYIFNLSFARSSLMYDIANYAYIEGHKLEIDDDAPIRAHLLADITAEGNVDRVSRVLALVFAQVCTLLAPIAANTGLSASGHNADIHNTLDEQTVFSLSIRRDPHRHPAAVDFLSKVVHEYMVCRAIHDWLWITHPAYAVPWLTRASEAERQISTMVAAWHSPLSRRCCPW